MITIALKIMCGRLRLRVCANASANINVPKHQKAASEGEIDANNNYNLRLVWCYGTLCVCRYVMPGVRGVAIKTKSKLIILFTITVQLIRVR